MTKLLYILNFSVAMFLAIISDGQVILYTQNFDGFVAPAFPTGWIASGVGTLWKTNGTSPSSGYTGSSGNNNADCGSNGTSTLVFNNNLSTVGFKNITVSWGERFTATGIVPAFFWSSNGGATWNPVILTDVYANTNWLLVNGGTAISLPAGAEGVSNLEFKFVSASGGGSYRMDDFSVKGIPVCIAPTTQSRNIIFSNVRCDQMDINWTNGNGSKRIVVVKAGSVITEIPSDNSTYSENTIFGNGNTLDAGEFVVFNNSNGPVTVTGLAAGTNYYFSVFEYNCDAGSEKYFTALPLNGNQQTLPYSVPNAGPDQYICSAINTTTMVATGAGTWSQIGGTPATITTPSSATTTITSLTSGIYVFRWTSSCDGTYSDMEIVVQ
jgi:hypothetical protein